MPSLSASWHAITYCDPCKACPVLKRKGGVDAEGCEGKGFVGEEERERLLVCKKIKINTSMNKQKYIS